MKPKSLGCNINTVIATTNAVISHIKLGIFVSECLVEGCEPATNGFGETIVDHRIKAARTPSGKRFRGRCQLVLRQSKKDDFPIIETTVSIEIEEGGIFQKPLHFQCWLYSDHIGVHQIDNAE